MGSSFVHVCEDTYRFFLDEPNPDDTISNLDLQEWVRPSDAFSDQTVEYICSVLPRFMDDLPADVTQAEMDWDGNVLSTPSDPQLDRTWVPPCPLRTDFPRLVPTVRRRDLTEVDRFGSHTDLVRYSPKPGETRLVVFKYNTVHGCAYMWWHEANVVVRMPRHPNIVPLDALVTDVIGGEQRVVGFTTRYIPGETLARNNRLRQFKLKYLKQLISAIDYLNLTLGIQHGELCPWNLLIDAETGSIQVCDFNGASKIGWEGDDQSGEEVFQWDPPQMDAAAIMRKRKWVKYRRAWLDSPVDGYVRVLKEWVRARANIDKKINHFSKASAPLTWPPLKIGPSMDWVTMGSLRRVGRPRKELVEQGKDFLT
ncbi:hypothetical protein VTK26DRAFT_6406 [Humicola hyalothermophila]